MYTRGRCAALPDPRGPAGESESEYRAPNPQVVNIVDG